MQVISFFSIGPKRLLKTQTFEKKGQLFSGEIILAYFFRTIERDKRQETTYKGTKGIVTSTVQMIR